MQSLGTRRVERGERQGEGKQSGRAAALTAELAAQPEKEVSEVWNHPPGLHDEPAKAGSVTSLAMNSPFSLAASSSLAASVSSLSAGTGLFNHARGLRTAARIQEVAAMLDENTEFLRQGNWQRRVLDAATTHRDEV